MPTSQAHDLDVDLLEPLLRQLVDLIGLPATMAIVEACGGTLLIIPRQADQNEFLLRLVGPEKAAILGRALGPDRLLIPKAVAALTAARNRRILAQLKTRSVRQVAREFGLGERQVWYIKSEADEADDSGNLGLFD